MEIDKFQKIPEIRLDKTKLSVVNDFDDTDEVEYWRNTTTKEHFSGGPHNK
jgi:hypothetical protein